MNRQSSLVVSVMVCVRALVTVIGLLTVLVQPHRATAQPVYFEDHFEGNALKPHWILPPPEHWTYEVSDSKLNVSELKWPKVNNAPNYVRLQGKFDTPIVGDFAAEVLVSFDLTKTADGLRNFGFGLSDQPPGVPTTLGAGITLSDAGSNDEIAVFGSVNAKGVQTTQFKNTQQQLLLGMIREGTEYTFTLDNKVIGKLEGQAVTMQSFGFLFSVDYTPGVFMPMRVDRVTIIPAPSIAFAVVVAVGCCGLLPRRRRI